MKIDMHCHTKEGSIDGKVPIEEYIRLLKNQGFGGMLVTPRFLRRLPVLEKAYQRTEISGLCSFKGH